MVSLVLIIVGFFPLLYGANLLVDASTSLAKRLNISNITIGLTIVAFGTSSPELVVNILSSLSGNSDIALGNVVGSNIFNILGILGISALIYPLSVKSNTTWIEIPLCILSSLVLLVVANDKIITGASISIVDRIDGIILLFFFIIFLSYVFQLMKSGKFEEEIEVKNYSLIKSVFFIIVGLILLVLGGNIVVSNTVKFAEYIGLSERVIALTIVAIGTSLPELATSAVAAKKKNVDIAIGNIVGSNIFNIFFILGISAVINPIFLQRWSNFDMIINVFSSILLFIFIFTGKGRRIDKIEGFLFLLVYVLYVTVLVIFK